MPERPTPAEVLDVPRERVADLAELAARTFREAYSDADDPEGFHAYVRNAFSEESIAREMDDPDTRFRWAIVETVPVGYLKVDRAPLPRGVEPPALGPGIHIHRLYVLARHRGSGLGRALLEDAVRIAGTEGSGYLWLSVWERNTNAIAFYQHHGLEVFGEDRFEIGNEIHRDLLMWKLV
jgi:ribosomal protein S18 acetylase RimI-like enzyme